MSIHRSQPHRKPQGRDLWMWCISILSLVYVRAVSSQVLLLLCSVICGSRGKNYHLWRKGFWLLGFKRDMRSLNVLGTIEWLICHIPSLLKLYNSFMWTTDWIWNHNSLMIFQSSELLTAVIKLLRIELESRISLIWERIIHTGCWTKSTDLLRRFNSNDFMIWATTLIVQVESFRTLSL